MATSQNGWSVITPSKVYLMTKNYYVGRTVVRLRRNEAGWLLHDLLKFIDKNVENIEAEKDDWGYAYRAIRGQTTGYSNHASATAVDVNAIRHPLGKTGTWSAEKKQKIHNKLKQYDGCIRWGEDYNGRIDPMHFEINASRAKVQATVKRIKAERAKQ